MLEPHAWSRDRPRKSPDGTHIFHLIRSCHSIHVRPMCQTNILIDGGGAAWVAGLGNMSIAKTTVSEGRADADRLSRSHAPKLTWPGGSPNTTDPTQPTKAGDMYAFGIMAWEVQTDSLIQHRSTCSL